VWPFKCKKCKKLEKHLKEVVDAGYEILDIHKKEMKKVKTILKAYAKWDDMIIANMKANNPDLDIKEGPATSYLKIIGEYDGEYGH